MPSRAPRKPARTPPEPPPAPPPGAGRGAPGAHDQLTVCTRLCGGRCCRYVTVGIPAPRSVDDWDEVRWWLAHQGTMVTRDEDGWMLHVRTPCSNLGPENACRVYPDHMLACQGYDASDCEFTGDVPFDVLLRDEGELAAYLERRRLKRGRGVAQAIRRVEARRRAEALAPAASPPPRLVSLEGLPR